MAKNPMPAPMKDATDNDSLHNHGFASPPAKNGQTIIEPYGLDRSTDAGATTDERSTMRGFRGGPNDVSHSLRGTTANQTGQSRK